LSTSNPPMSIGHNVVVPAGRTRGASGAASPFDYGTLAQSHCYETPYLLLDADRIRANVTALREAFGLVSPQLFYAVKANPELSVLGLLDEMGCGFDVASLNELRRLTRIGIDPARAVFSSPVKVPGHIAQAYALGVTRFAFDSETELEKIAAHAPGSKVVLRLEVPANGSRWPLAGKFGVPASEAVALLSSARTHGLVPHGLTFHVGSQCLRPESWSDAIAICRDVWRAAAAAGIHLELLNLGGGLPKQYGEDVPELSAIGSEAVRSIAEARFGPGVTYAIEPGRFVTADAGAIGTSVIGKATRQGMPWVYVDLSIYSGLLEVIGGWEYPILTPRDGEPRQMTVLAGPTCDSTDVIAREVMLPDLEVGDRLLLLQAGAYTVGYREYNGFEFPAVHVTGAAARTGEMLSAVAG
jgi:ornithine decarboxylase